MSKDQIKEYYQRVNGYTEYGLFNFRHGIKHNDTLNQDYFLDFDYFKEGGGNSRSIRFG